MVKGKPDFSITGRTVIEEVELISKMPDTTPRGSAGIAFRQAAGVGAGWISPTGSEDPLLEWLIEANAYDGNVASRAEQAQDFGQRWYGPLILTLAAPIHSNKLRFKASEEYWGAALPGRKVDIDVFKDGEWVDAAELTDWDVTDYVEVSYSEGTVTKVRLRFYKPRELAAYAYVYEVGVYQSATSGGELEVITKQDDETLSKATVYQPNIDELMATIKFLEEGTLYRFKETVTADLIVPALGEHVQVLSAFYYCDADIITEMRYKTGGHVVIALPTLGSIGAQRLSKQIGGDTETLELYMSGAGNAKGWLLYKIV